MPCQSSSTTPGTPRALHPSGSGPSGTPTSRHGGWRKSTGSAPRWNTPSPPQRRPSPGRRSASRAGQGEDSRLPLPHPQADARHRLPQAEPTRQHLEDPHPTIDHLPRKSRHSPGSAPKLAETLLIHLPEAVTPMHGPLQPQRLHGTHSHQPKKPAEEQTTIRIMQWALKINKTQVVIKLKGCNP